MSKFIETEVAIGAKVSGHYKLQIREIDGSLVRELEFDNLITNNGLDRIIAGRDQVSSINGFLGTYINQSKYCQVGTGTATPAYTDTQLTSYFAQVEAVYSGATSGLVSATSGVYPTAPGGSYTTHVYRFPAGTFNNTVITEVGLTIRKGATIADKVLFSHALITDGVGTPTPITLTSSQILDVSYTFKFIPPAVDTTFSTIINGTSYSVTCRPVGVSETTGSAGYANWQCATDGTGAGFGIPGGHPTPQTPYATVSQSVSNSATLTSATALVSRTSMQWGYSNNATFTVTKNAYVNGNYYIDYSYLYDKFVYNTGNLRSFFVFTVNAGSWQLLFDQVIPKTSSQQLILNARASISRL